jgi:hypothetical protein
MLALASLAIAVVTGIGLAPGYDVRAPLPSLAGLSLSSWAGQLLRGVHAWSSHLVLLLGLLHIVEHFAAGSDRRVRQAVWLRLVVAVPLVLALALTGFMLKGDAEGELAREVVRGLLERLPGAGTALGAALLGVGDDLQVVYVHHVATLTVLVALVVLEHARVLWPAATAVVMAGAAATGLAWALPPGLHAGLDPVVKGPWYFVAVQEVLHWLTRPGWLWLAGVAWLAALALAPRLASRGRRQVLVGLVVALIAYAGLGVFAQLFRGAGWQLGSPWRPLAASQQPAGVISPVPLAALARVPTVLGRPEGCLACHGEVTGLGPSHDPQALGCASCHLGDPFAPDAAGAHRGMVLVPGNLDSVGRTCGRAGCHDAVAGRVSTSLMATVRGLVAVDRFAFGEQPTPDGEHGVARLGHSPADSHLRQMCVVCHLGSGKVELGPVTEATRGGGCAACHARYPAERDYRRDHVAGFAHPAVGVQVADDSCFGCHSRSGRIALSYAGWWEAGFTEAEARARPAGDTRKLMDGRILARTTPDAHQARGMACIDCHTASELMGDGAVHHHEEEATRVRCETCHRVAPAKSLALAELPAEPRIIVRGRFGDTPPPRYLVEDRTGEALTNVWPTGERTVEVRTKLGGKVLAGKPPAPSCSGIDGHERLSCRACHEAQVTQCIACHTQWDAQGVHRDALTGEQAPGRWVEYDSQPRLGIPAMGVRERGGRAEIVPFAPGMVMTLNRPDVPVPAPLPDDATQLVGPRTRTLRAYAPVVPHATTRRGLTCVACHLDPLALGYGAGTLSPVTRDGRLLWRFEARHAASSWDGLPADAWVRIFDAAGGQSTRTGARPLSVDEQRRVLDVGACLGCHDPATPRGRAFYGSYRQARQRLSPACRVPAGVAD